MIPDWDLPTRHAIWLQPFASPSFCLPPFCAIQQGIRLDVRCHFDEFEPS